MASEVSMSSAPALVLVRAAAMGLQTAVASAPALVLVRVAAMGLQTAVALGMASEVPMSLAVVWARGCRT
jgi:hypothetical protein